MMAAAEKPGRGLARLLKRVAAAQSWLFLSLIYGLLWLPAGWIARLCADWLRVRAPRDSAWLARSERLNNPQHLKDPF